MDESRDSEGMGGGVENQKLKEGKNCWKSIIKSLKAVGLSTISIRHFASL